MLNAQDYQSIFPYGEVGGNLDGFRDSEISNQSAKEIKNFYISTMGTLRVAKQYKETEIIPDLDENEYIIKQKSTKYNFFFIFTQKRIFVVEKESQEILYEYALVDLNIANLEKSSNISLFSDFIYVKDINGLSSILGFSKEGLIGTTDYFDSIELPFAKKQDVSIDIYQCFSLGGKLRLELLTNYNGDATLEVKDGSLYLYNSQIKIDRIYKQYKSNITAEQINKAVKGMVIMVFRNYQTTDGELTYHLKNTKLVFGEETEDNSYGSSYYSNVTTENCNGDLVYGILENFLKNLRDIVDICEFKSRLIISTKEKIYVSKVLDYNNFVPTTTTDGAFFLKPSTINENQPIIERILSGDGLYVLTSEGILVIGYESNFTYASPSVRIAGNTPSTKTAVLIEGILYYLDEKGLLRAILPDFTNGIIKFTNVIVEKYNYDSDRISHISKGMIDNRSILIVTPKTGDYMEIYSPLNDNLFRKFSLSFNLDHPIIGYGEDLFCQGSIFRLTETNMKTCSVTTNLPFIQTKHEGVYLNDFKLQYRRIVLNLYAPTKDSIKGVYISDNPIQKLGIDSGDYSLFSFMGSLSVIGMDIKIITNETDEVIEIRGINRFVS